MQEFCVDSGVKRLGHPPYSPDLAPNYSWLIRQIKRRLALKHVEGEQKLVDICVICHINPDRQKE